MNPIQHKVEADLASHGWHVVKVLEDGADEPPFAYTIGLTVSFGHPEVVIFGLGLDDMHWMLNEIGERVRGGTGFGAHVAIGGLIEGYTCKFVRVDRRWYDELLGQALAYYGSAEFEVLQCLWPDREGRFPDDADFDVELRALQPVLST